MDHLLKKKKKERRRRIENFSSYCGSSEHTLEICSLKNKCKSSSSISYITNPKPKITSRLKISDQLKLKGPIFEFTLNILKIIY